MFFVHIYFSAFLFQLFCDFDHHPIHPLQGDLTSQSRANNWYQSYFFLDFTVEHFDPMAGYDLDSDALCFERY